ncbi:MAG: hypothetical protein JXR78_16740, partial [Victivallales bacterium]|nr:hypothetical protein [Victivallales bacterium]
AILQSFIGRWALMHNAELGLGVPGESLYWDRFIRNEQHLMSVIEYIHNNPVKAGFCNVAGQWRWSSAPNGFANDEL